jgi:mono/diheme cytochrome c family protein
LIAITGHLGGTLTHGDGYLTKAISASTKDAEVSKKTISNAQEAFVYADIITPILEQKCYGCHAAKKQKGGLRLDSKDWILKGGKDGSMVKAGNADGSELYHRIIMDPLEEKHMPPKGKPQMTEQERVLLQWWINSGMDFNRQVKMLDQTPQIKQALAALEKNTPVVNHDNDLPKESVEEAPRAVLEGLRSKGITILPVASNSHYLTANCVNLKSMDTQTIDWLFSLRKQLLWLKMPAMQLKETEWMKLANCTSLRRLNLEHANINNQGVIALKALTELNYLNLVGTNIHASALIELKGMNNLKELFLAETKMPAADFLLLKQAFSKTSIDTGGYTVPMLVTDTQLVKKK